MDLCVGLGVSLRVVLAPRQLQSLAIAIIPAYCMNDHMVYHFLDYTWDVLLFAALLNV